MSDSFISKSNLARILALEGAISMLASALPEDKQNAFKRCLKRTADKLANTEITPIKGITDEEAKKLNALTSDAFLRILDLIPTKENPPDHS